MAPGFAVPPSDARLVITVDDDAVANADLVDSAYQAVGLSTRG